MRCAKCKLGVWTSGINAENDSDWLLQCRYNFWDSFRSNEGKERRKSTRSGTSSDRRPSLIDMTRGTARSSEDEGPSLIGLHGGGIGDKALKSPPCMRQALVSSFAPKRGIIPVENFCRANSALPPLIRSHMMNCTSIQELLPALSVRDREQCKQMWVYTVWVCYKYKHTRRLTGPLNLPSLNAITIFAV